MSNHGPECLNPDLIPSAMSSVANFSSQLGVPDLEAEPSELELRTAVKALPGVTPLEADAVSTPEALQCLLSHCEEYQEMEDTELLRDFLKIAADNVVHEKDPADVAFWRCEARIVAAVLRNRRP